MAEIWHVLSEDHYRVVFSKYYASKDWAARKVQQLKRHNPNCTVGLRVLRGEWEEINV